MIPIELLERVEKISTLKVLIFFYKKAQEPLHYSLKEIALQAEVSENSAINGIRELLSMGVIEKVKGTGRTSHSYRFIVESKEALPSGWKKATGAQKKKEASADEPSLDLENILLLDKDINSLSVVNPNLYLTDKQLGKIANQIFLKEFAPWVGEGKKPRAWFIQQVNIAKDLLVEYRTEQVVGAIRYWTLISPPPNGMTSLRYLTFKTKKGTKVIEALDFWKTEYLKAAPELEKEEREQRKEEVLRKVKEEEQAQVHEKEKIEQMDDQDFLKGLLGGFGKIEV